MKFAETRQKQNNSILHLNDNYFSLSSPGSFFIWSGKLEKINKSNELIRSIWKKIRLFDHNLSRLDGLSHFWSENLRAPIFLLRTASQISEQFTWFSPRTFFNSLTSKKKIHLNLRDILHTSDWRLFLRKKTSANSRSKTISMTWDL